MYFGVLLGLGKHEKNWLLQERLRAGSHPQPRSSFPGWAGRGASLGAETASKTVTERWGTDRDWTMTEPSPLLGAGAWPRRLSPFPPRGRALSGSRPLRSP